jgi:glycosyltransferase involved in cell wall biosynthesis
MRSQSNLEDKNDSIQGADDLSDPREGKTDVQPPQLVGRTPLVSIITPTYNHERYIGSCIKSVLHQNYENWEQIIIDDGSTDRTADVICNYSDRRVRYVHQKNAGIEALASTYNSALKHCHGPLIAILEGDDTWPPYKLEAMIDAFSDPDVVLAYGEMREIDPAGNVAQHVGRTAQKYRKLSISILSNDPVRSAVPYMLTVPGHSMVPASTAVIRRTALDAIGGFQYVEGQLYTDFPTFIMLALQGKFRFFPQIMGYRRMHPASATAQFFERMLERSQKHLSELLMKPEFKLNPIEMRQVQRSWRTVSVAVRFRRGRLLLIEKEWAEARRNFRDAFQFGDAMIAGGAIAGWCVSWLHCDLESLFRWAGRPGLAAD